MYQREEIRNVAIIAHVDHGKTTLVDALLRQSHTFRDNEKVAERVMDSNDLERERGITILSKNTSVKYQGHTINIVDTPGHADFGGEVERVLKMVDSVLLVVDSYEGPMPQTKFVLKKALELMHCPIVVINKIDRKDARPNEVINEVFDLFLELGATDEQCDFPVLYASAREGYAMEEPDGKGETMTPLFDAIITKVKPPTGDPDAPLQMLVSTLDSSEYMGKLAVGKIERGRIRKNMNVAIMNRDGSLKKNTVSALFINEGLKRVETQEASLGDIVAIAGLGDVSIGDTVADALAPEALPFMDIDEPTLSMNFMVNDSPFAGREGDFVTSRHLRDRLMREIQTNVSMRVQELSPDCFEVSGRGELHLSILLETMRREGYELQVSKPSVIFHEVDGKRMEPMEALTIDVPEDFVGPVMEKLGPRKAEMVNMSSAVNGYSRLEFVIPARGLIGFRNEFMTDTRGNGIMNHVFKGYGPYKGDIPERNRGSLVVFETGTAITYGLFNAQERGDLFLDAGTEVYAGMICGQCARADDIEVNVCKKKHLSNTRSSGSDDALKLTPPIQMSLENCLEFIRNDELVEITPKNIRMRKRILDPTLRKRAARK
ncbi:GTP-binding protein TypA/BipA [Clostridiaceae bacterium JG1575]|nr:GTP-binding protein TypA/BipA [Clostridiaceae bacterium JG1575]